MITLLIWVNPANSDTEPEFKLFTYYGSKTMLLLLYVFCGSEYGWSEVNGVEPPVTLIVVTALNGHV